MQHPMLTTAVKAARRAASIINRASFDLEQIRDYLSQLHLSVSVDEHEE